MSVMRLSTLCAAAYAAFFGLNVQAAEPPARGLTAAFGNTIRTTYPDGRLQHIWLHPDGSWDAIGRRGKPSSGKWTAKEDKVCMKQIKPFASPFKYCTALPADGAVGVVWTSKDMVGEPIKLTLVKGIAKPND